MLGIIYTIYCTFLCIDVDECLSAPCPITMLCNNMDGNYTCDCPDGTTKNGTNCYLSNDVTYYFVNIFSCLVPPGSIPVPSSIIPPIPIPSTYPSISTSVIPSTSSGTTSANLSTTSPSEAITTTITLIMSPSVIPNVSGNDHAFSTGAIAGIIVGSFFGLIVIIVFAMVLRLVVST